MRKINADYFIDGTPEHYQVFNAEGRLLMYFKLCSNDSNGLFLISIDSNVEFNNINDALINYCYFKICFGFQNEKWKAVFMTKIIQRIMSMKHAHRLFIDSHFLCSQGKVQYALLNVYNKIKSSMVDTIDSYLDHNIPYSKDEHTMLMEILNVPKMISYMTEMGEEIEKEEFEKNIPNEKIGHAYVNYYCSNAKYHKFWDKEDAVDMGYLMLIDGELVLMFAVKYIPSTL